MTGECVRVCVCAFNDGWQRLAWHFILGSICYKQSRSIIIVHQIHTLNVQHRRIVVVVVVIVSENRLGVFFFIIKHQSNATDLKTTRKIIYELYYGGALCERWREDDNAMAYAILFDK